MNYKAYYNYMVQVQFILTSQQYCKDCDYFSKILISVIWRVWANKVSKLKWYLLFVVEIG